MNGRNGDWCGRLASAVADGRYLEEPDVWREHLAGCPSCRELVGGLETLRQRIDRAAARVREQVDAPPDGEALIAEAFRRYRSARRVRGLSLGVVVLIGLALGIVFLARGSSAPQSHDPAARARRLHDRVFGLDAAPDYGLLQRDEALRSEYLAALDDESSLVRRTALQALMYSGVELDPQRLTEILTTWDEDLEAPLEVAAQGPGGRHLEDALARRRDETLEHVLSGAHVQAAQGGARLDAQVIEPFVDHPRHSIRTVALRALSQDPTYRPGERIARRLTVEADVEARKAAAWLLLDRLGAEGVEIVLERLRADSDWGLEGVVLYRLGSGPAALAFSRERIGDPSIPVQLALHHQRRMHLEGDASAPPQALLDRALQDEDPRTWVILARIASEQDLGDLRTTLQTRWKDCPEGPVRTSLGRYLVLWDCEGTDESRLHLALDILEAGRDPRLRAQVEKLAASDLPSVRERAQNLLSDW